MTVSIVIVPCNECPVKIYLSMTSALVYMLQLHKLIC